jgi:hypothetical protein
MDLMRAMDNESVFTEVKLTVCCYFYTVLVVGLIGPTRDRMTASDSYGVVTNLQT